MKEGCAYDSYHVQTKRPGFGHMIVDLNMQLRFSEINKFIPVDEFACSIPRYAFRFMQFHELEERIKAQTEKENIVLQGKFWFLNFNEILSYTFILTSYQYSKFTFPFLSKTYMVASRMWWQIRKSSFRQETRWNLFVSLPLKTIGILFIRTVVHWNIEFVLIKHQQLTSKIQKCRRETVMITLWGHLARNFNVETIENRSPPVLAVFTSLRLARYKGIFSWKLNHAFHICHKY